MKIIPDTAPRYMQNQSNFVKIDAGAMCFFSLGMFLSAIFLHHFILI